LKCYVSSNFGHFVILFEKVINLTLNDVEWEGAGFGLTFKKGKFYQFGELHLSIIANHQNLDFNPSHNFSVYLDSVVFLLANSDNSSD
jgi:hypothetical protein